ncbi:DHH family phosphoesterase [Campylobacter coli]
MVKDNLDPIIANRIKDEKHLEQITANIDIYKYLYDFSNVLIDIEKADKLLNKHINNKSHVVIVSDFDNDGLNGCAIGYKICKHILNLNTEYVFNKRIYGRGFTKAVMEQLKIIHELEKIDLIISVDHGSNDEEQFKELKSLGIDLLITDHHEIETYPDSADVFINPIRNTDIHYDISGCTVLFLVLYRIAYTLKNKPNNYKAIVDECIWCVATTVISDLMDMSLPVNRYIVKEGLRIANGEYLTIRDIIFNILKIKDTIINYRDISYLFAPMINSGNRTNNENTALQFLLTTNITDAYNIGKKLSMINNYRKKISKDTISNIETYMYQDSKYPIVFLQEGVNIAGSIAAMCGEKYNNPCIAFNREKEGLLAGSFRGILKDLNILEVFNNINKIDNKILKEYGGHKGAGGCLIYKDRIEDFIKLYNKELDKIIDNYKVEETYNVDEIITFNNIDDLFNLYNRVMKYSPYGKNWEEPIFESEFFILSIFNIKIGYIIMFNIKNEFDIEDGIVRKAYIKHIPEKIKEYNSYKFIYKLYRKHDVAELINSISFDILQIKDIT